ncbi:MAG: oligosaccharide flippase family protein [Flavobacteriia bacterium]|nr:oligosaccharide flippase family protein [Flavobacteriia bacterium]
MNPFKKLLGQTAVYGLSSIVGRLLNYLLVPLYTFVFKNPADYGDVSLLYAWVAFLVVFLTFGMETTYFRFLNFKDNKNGVYQNSFFTLLVLNSLFLLITLFFNQSIADLLLFSEHNEYVVLLALIVYVDSINALPLAKLRAEEKAFTFAGIQIISIVVNIIFNLVFMLVFFNNDRPEEGVFFILLINLISSLTKSVFLFRNFKLNIAFFDVHLIIDMLKYAFPLVIAGFAGIINETLDRILLERILFIGGKSLHEAKTEVGIYSAVYKLAMLVTIFLQAYRYAAEPFFFSQAKSENKNEMYVKTMNYFIAAVCFVFLFVSLNIDIFKYFIQNESYWVGLQVVPILLMANVCLGIYYNQSIWYKLSGQTKFGAYISIGGALLTILLNVLFIPFYGFYACAWATLIVYACQMSASYFLGQKFHPIPYNIKRFALYILFSLALFFISKSLESSRTIYTLLINNLLIILFIIVVLRVEKGKLFTKSL